MDIEPRMDSRLEKNIKKGMKSKYSRFKQLAIDDTENKAPYEYTDSDYQELDAALKRASSVSCGAPDRYQFHQNELSKHIAYFLLKPYNMKKLTHK